MFSTGEVLHCYRLVEKIGEGGRGVVWRAVDTRLGRDVAVKFLNDSLRSDPQWLARFEREAKTLAALNHPNIVTIHSIETHGEHVFLVMELIRGTTLDRAIPGGGMVLDHLIDLGMAIADAVSAAHGLGVIHGDLKPGNIMIREDGHLKVLDFGLARSSDPARRLRDDDTTRTLETEGRLEGTLPYMAPEQVRGEPLDARSDLFSIGVVLYEMATGSRPFGGGTAAEVIAAILRDEPRFAPETRPGLPRQLGRIFEHALQKDPDRRFQTANDLRNELELLRRELAREATVPELRSLAVLPLDNVSGDAEQAYFSDGMTDLLINSLARIRALKVISRTSTMRYKGRRQSLAETARELGVEAIVEGSVMRVGDRVRITARLIDAARDRLLWAGSYEHGLDDVLALQGRVAREIAGQVEVEITPQERAHLARVRRADPAAHEAYLRGRHLWYERTTESVRKGLHYFEQATRIDPSYAPAHAGIADSYIVDGGRYLQVTPAEAYARARVAARRAVELDDALAEAHTSLAAVLTDYDWDWDAAEREYRRAIELNPSYATARSWFAEHLSRMGRHDEAIAQVRRVPELDPVSAFSNMIVSWILYFARRYDEAVEHGRRTLAQDPDYATAYRILGWAYEETGRFDDAIACHRRAGELTDQAPNFTVQLGRAYALAGRSAEAREVLAAATRRSRSTYVSSLDIAIIHAALGESGPALDWLERAYDERADHLPYIKVNPRLDPLRREPRFRRILETMSLAPRDSERPEPTSTD